MNNKTDLLEEYVNFVDNTKKQNKYFKKIKFFITIILSLVLFFRYLNITQRSICTIIRIIVILFVYV